MNFCFWTLATDFGAKFQRETASVTNGDTNADKSLTPCQNGAYFVVPGRLELDFTFNSFRCPFLKEKKEGGGETICKRGGAVLS